MQESCSFCEGTGYFQLITGGSETCPSCLGSGTEKEQKKEAPVADAVK